jgi:hypothetical protein
MAWDEASAWLAGAANKALYQDLLDDATTRPSRIALRKKIVHPDEMPWEMSRQGLLKHLLNEQMNTRMETVDAYMQVIPPGSRSGKHRHLAEECLYVVRMGSRRRHLYPALHHPSALQRRSGTAGAADLLHQPHLQEFRPQRFGADRERAGTRPESGAHGGAGAGLSRTPG